MTIPSPLTLRTFISALATTWLALLPACGQRHAELDSGDLFGDRDDIDDRDDEESPDGDTAPHGADACSSPAVDGGAPVDGAAFGCGFGPGEQGCVCGFKSSVDPAEWEGYQIDCDAFGGFCRAECCPPGQRVDASDPTRCVPEPGLPPELRSFGPWPDYADEIESMRLNWVVYGADRCRAEVRIDGGAPIARESAGGADLIAIDEFDDAVDQAALDATLTCENESGAVSASYQIAAASERVTVTGLGGGFPQPVQICWSVLPFLVTDVPPFSGGQCHVGVCPAGEEFDPFSSFPCFDPSAFFSVADESGCVDTAVNVAPGDRAYVSCENGDVQRAVHSRIIGL
jgi:hypothetical protein